MTDHHVIEAGRKDESKPDIIGRNPYIWVSGLVRLALVKSLHSGR